jgi:prephenate dehydrogenase
MFDKVAIVGPGLIGASMGMALRTRGLAKRVVGIGRRQESLDRALSVGAIDKATMDPAQGVQRADLVVLATPIGALSEVMAQICEALDAEAILTDVASSKVKVIETISSALRSRPDVAYIPTHPMAGSEQSGPLAASAELFEGAICIITPLTNTFPESKGRITHMWNALGARVVSMTPQAHDRAVARISHMPHLAAAAILAVLDETEMALCGKGLLDTTRVASGSPDLWLDICKTNRTNIRDSLNDYMNALKQIADALDDGNLGPLRAMLAEAKQKRDRLVEKRQTLTAPSKHGPHRAGASGQCNTESK